MQRHSCTGLHSTARLGFTSDYWASNGRESATAMNWATCFTLAFSTSAWTRNPRSCSRKSAWWPCGRTLRNSGELFSGHKRYRGRCDRLDCGATTWLISLGGWSGAKKWILNQVEVSVAISSIDNLIDSQLKRHWRVQEWIIQIKLNYFGLSQRCSFDLSRSKSPS